jgi:hypothetical protein
MFVLLEGMGIQWRKTILEGNGNIMAEGMGIFVGCTGYNTKMIY